MISVLEKQRKEGQYIRLHSHDYYEIVYYFYGSGTSTVGGRRYSISSHTFVVIPPKTEHEEYHTADGKLFCILFQSTEVLNQQIHQDIHGKIDQIGKAIICEITEQNILYREMAALKLRELLFQTYRLENNRDNSKTMNVEYVVNYIAQNYHERIVMRDIADQMNISYDYFQHRFKEIKGESPRQFLVRTRIDEARHLLGIGTLSCTEIAYRCGFSSAAQFTAIFKRETGLTPKAYLRANTSATSVR